MFLSEAIKQLESLKEDRKSFLENDTEHDEIFLKDIEAIDVVLRKIDKLKRKNKKLVAENKGLKADNYMLHNTAIDLCHEIDDLEYQLYGDY